jgi:hypothetical protein
MFCLNVWELEFLFKIKFWGDEDLICSPSLPNLCSQRAEQAWVHVTNDISICSVVKDRRRGS